MNMLTRCTRVGWGAIVLLVTVLGGFVIADAATVNLAVDANTEADWASDNLYRASGTCALPGAFAKVQTAVKSATPTFADTVSADGDYCYRATAVDTAGNESITFSNMVGVTVNVNPPAAPANLRKISVTP